MFHLLSYFSKIIFIESSSFLIFFKQNHYIQGVPGGVCVSVILECFIIKKQNAEFYQYPVPHKSNFYRP